MYPSYTNVLICLLLAAFASNAQASYETCQARHVGCIMALSINCPIDPEVPELSAQCACYPDYFYCTSFMVCEATDEETFVITPEICGFSCSTSQCTAASEPPPPSTCSGLALGACVAPFTPEACRNPCDCMAGQLACMDSANCLTPEFLSQGLTSCQQNCSASVCDSAFGPYGPIVTNTATEGPPRTDPINDFCSTTDPQCYADFVSCTETAGVNICPCVEDQATCMRNSGCTNAQIRSEYYFYCDLPGDCAFLSFCDGGVETNVATTTLNFYTDPIDDYCSTTSPQCYIDFYSCMETAGGNVCPCVEDQATCMRTSGCTNAQIKSENGFYCEFQCKSASFCDGGVGPGTATAAIGPTGSPLACTTDDLLNCANLLFMECPGADPTDPSSTCPCMKSVIQCQVNAGCELQAGLDEAEASCKAVCSPSQCDFSNINIPRTDPNGFTFHDDDDAPRFIVKDTFDYVALGVGISAACFVLLLCVVLGVIFLAMRSADGGARSRGAGGGGGATYSGRESGRMGAEMGSRRSHVSRRSHRSRTASMMGGATMGSTQFARSRKSSGIASTTAPIGLSQYGSAPQMSTQSSIAAPTNEYSAPPPPSTDTYDTVAPAQPQQQAAQMGAPSYGPAYPVMTVGDVTE